LATNEPGRPKRETPGERISGGVQTISTVIDLSLSLVGGTLAGGFFGWLLDRALNYQFVFTLIFGFLGFGAGITIVIKKFRQHQPPAQ
jgi:F0F1-type ATP synthase assembly protein I